MNQRNERSTRGPFLIAWGRARGCRLLCQGADFYASWPIFMPGGQFLCRGGGDFYAGGPIFMPGGQFLCRGTEFYAGGGIFMPRRPGIKNVIGILCRVGPDIVAIS